MEIKQINIKDRIINLFDDITEESVKTVIEKINDINIKDDEFVIGTNDIIHSLGVKSESSNISLPPIILNLSTYGGDVYSGFGLCDAIRMSETKIKCICYGKIMSMGIPILLSAEHKAAHKNTTFMIHSITSGVWGKTSELTEGVEQIKKLQEQMIDFICSRSKFPRKKFEEIIDRKQDYYFNAEEALKYKFIDEIIDVVNNEENNDITKEVKTKSAKNNKNKK